MPDRNDKTPVDEERGLLDGKSVSRREFLKFAGIAGATVGMGAGLGGLVAACGGSDDTTATTGSATTVAGGTSTSVSASAEGGAPIQIGYVVPITGGMAAFGVPAKWIAEEWQNNIWKDGMVLGDSKKHPIKVIVTDSQSDSNRSAQVAGDLITNTGVTLIGADASASNVVPVRDTAEALGCPCITTDCPGDAWAANEPKGGFKWSWHAWWIAKDIAGNFMNMWTLIPNNNKVGAMWANDADGLAFANGLPPVFKEKGLTLVDPGRFNDATEDYSAQISLFKKEGVEVICGMMNPPDFANFWKQAVQQSFHPKIVTCAKALLFPDGVEALGDLGDGMTVECWFHPTFPFKSALTGATPQEVCDKYTADTGRQWTQPVIWYGMFEIWTDVLKRATDPTKRDAIIAAVKQTNVMTIGGKVDWTKSPETYSGYENFCTMPSTGGQWVKGKGKYKYDLEIVGSATSPEIKTTATMKEVVYPV